MRSKIVDITRAADLVCDGDTVAFGGMTLYRRPMAFARELVRCGRRGLTALTFTGALETDLLIAAGCVSRVRSGYVGFEFLGLAPNFRQAVERGRIEMIDETEGTLAMGLRATTGGVTFMPMRGLVGTDILKVRRDLAFVECPYTGQRFVAAPPITPNVAVIHVQQADDFGNAVLEGNHAIDRDLVRAAKRVVITAEQIVPNEEIAQRRGKAQILGIQVDAVVHAPFGAHPTSCYPFYPVDIRHLIDYLKLAASEGSQSYLEKYVFGPRTPEEYIATARSELSPGG